jgi:hypothetical protein
LRIYVLLGNTAQWRKSRNLSNPKWNMPLELTFENSSISGIIILEYSNNIEAYSYEVTPQRLFAYLTMTSFCRIISGVEKHYSRNRVSFFVATPSCCLHADRLQKSGEEFESGIAINN